MTSDEEDATVRGDMEAQLRSLYEERARLQIALGTADSDHIIALVRSLEEQLLDLYADRARPPPED